MSLPEFLLARIAEREEAARKVLRVFNGPVPPPPIATAAFGMRMAPARVLAECAAKRRIVQECIEADEEAISGGVAARRVLRLLGLPDADHPDYDEAWRP